MSSTKQVNLYRHISMNVKTLKICGMWFFIPYPYLSIRFWLSVLNRIFLGFFIFFLPTFGQLTFLTKWIISGSAEIPEIAALLNLILTESMTSLKLLDLRFRRGHLQRLIDQFTNNVQTPFYDEVHAEILEKAIKTSRRLFKFFMFFCQLDVTVHSVLIPAVQHFKTLPMQMDVIFFDINNKAYFSYVCFYQILTKPIFVMAYVSLATLPWAAMIHAISHLDILTYNLKNMENLVKKVKLERNCNTEEAFKEVFKECFSHHHYITRFVTIIQSAFSGQMSVTLMIITGIYCTTAVQIISIGSPSKNISLLFFIILYIVLFGLFLFIECYIANTITVKGLQVATVLFECPWVNLSKDHKRNLVMFIARTQKPLVITASKLVPISLETFAKVMNWTYKGFALMNQMKK